MWVHDVQSTDNCIILYKKQEDSVIGEEFLEPKNILLGIMTKSQN